MSVYYEMTGSPREAGFKTKAELIKHLAGHGYVKDDLSGEGYGKVPDKVCDLLLTDSYDSPSSKMKKAKKMEIRILTFQDLLKELDEGDASDDDDESLENLRKFLESDDRAMRRMGLSMAKGSGVPDEMLGEILWMYMFHDDKTTRAAAKSTFMKLAPEDAKQAVKENWKASYRTDFYWPGKHWNNLGIGLGKALCQTSVSLVGPLIKALRDEEYDVRYYAARALEEIGDERAVEPLIKALSDNDKRVRRFAADALGEIGDERAVEPLIGVLSDVRKSAAGALDKLGWKPDTDELKTSYMIATEDWTGCVEMAKGSGVPDEMLGEILWMYMFHDDKTIRAAAKSTFMKLAPEDAKQAVKENWKASYRKHVDYVLENLGIDLGKALCQTSVSLVGPLIKALRDEYDIRYYAVATLRKIGDARVVEPLIEALENDYYLVRRNAAGALGEIGDARAVEPLIKALSDNDEWVRGFAADALGEIGDERAVQPLINALGDENRRRVRSGHPVRRHQWVRDAAKEALRKLGHEVE